MSKKEVTLEELEFKIKCLELEVLKLNTLVERMNQIYPTYPRHQVYPDYTIPQTYCSTKPVKA